MLALIDTDIVVYRVGFTTENEEEWIAKARCNEMIEGIIAETEATEYQLWLSDSTENNFRLKFFPHYKANRKDFVKPKHYDMLKEFVIKEWGAQITCNQEADDQLGIVQSTINGYLDNPEYGGDDSCICSIDKDLLQIPGNHYNFVKKEKQYVSPEQGLRYFYRQLLIGDTSDNIQGCPKIGSARADKALKDQTSERELFATVRRTYRDSYSKNIFQCTDLTPEQEKFVDDQILMNGRCLKIRTKENEIWDFPV